jgi:peptide/nickel transport system ATP-binding protein
MTPLLALDQASKHFGPRPAVAGVSFALDARGSLGIVGESGSGKTTVARMALGLIAPDAGSVSWQGVDLARAGAARLRELRRGCQAVFQDPVASLHPRKRLLELVGEAPRCHRLVADWRAHAAAELLRAGLPPALHDRFPHALSAGQRQRVALARALALRPQVLVCDEPVAALDVSIRGQILNLLRDVHVQDGVALLFISHDLPAVAGLCARVLVMLGGRVVEEGPTEVVLATPRHPYTQALVRAARGVAAGLPAATRPEGSGCPFAARCPDAQERCARELPPPVVAGEVTAACFLVEPARRG